MTLTISVDENDILRDEGEQYARNSFKQDLRSRHYHDYSMVNALADTPATKVTVQIVSEKLSGEALGTKSWEREPVAA